MTLENITSSQCIKTRNKSIIDLVYKHSATRKIEKNMLQAANQVRICKKMNLPCELLELHRNREKEVFENSLS